MTSDRRLHKHPAAIDVVCRAGAIAGRVGCDEERHVGDVRWNARPAQRDQGFGLASHVGVDHRLPVHRGQDHPRRNIINRNSVGGQFGGLASGEVAHPALGDAIGRGPGGADLLMDGADVDDPASFATCDHPPRGQPRAEERAVEIGLQHAVPHRGIELVDETAAALTRVVDEDVDLAERGIDLAEQAIDLGRVADVGLDDDRAPAGIANGRSRLLGPGPVAVVVDRDIGAAFGVETGDSLSDPAVRPGDQGDLSIQAKFHGYITFVLPRLEPSSGYHAIATRVWARIWAAEREDTLDLPRDMAP